MALSAVFGFFCLIGQPIFTAPAATPKAFAGTSTFSAYANSSTALKTVDRSYQGNIKISPTDKVTGRLTRTVSSFTNFLDDFVSKESSVSISGKITRVKNTTHGGYLVLEATTSIELSDGTKGTLSIYDPYTVKPPQISGSGTIVFKQITGSASLQMQ